MRRITLVLLIVTLLSAAFVASPAQADWRWTTPKMKVKKVKPVCGFNFCKKLARAQTRLHLKVRVDTFNARRLAEWTKVTRTYIPRCTWYGESGEGAQYAPYRYTMPNSTGSGALGKFQMMPDTYHANAKYHDWSPLDQEIAARNEFAKHGIFPWTNCTS